jgi:hypothetical protein
VDRIGHGMLECWNGKHGYFLFTLYDIYLEGCPCTYISNLRRGSPIMRPKYIYIYMTIDPDIKIGNGNTGFDSEKPSSEHDNDIDIEN